MGRKSEESKASYNEIAFTYDTSREGRYTAFYIEELVNMVELKENDVVLDVACGTGTLLGKLKQTEKIHAYGIDISDKMIDVARQKYPEIAFKVQSCCPLLFEDESVDVITVCCAFHHFEIPQNFVDECRRVLKENGRVYIADPNFSPLARVIANTIVFRFSKRGDVKVYSEKELKKFFYEAMFKDVKTVRKGMGVFLKATKQMMKLQRQ